jgi:hypothetical protein
MKDESKANWFVRLLAKDVGFSVRKEGFDSPTNHRYFWEKHMSKVIRYRQCRVVKRIPNGECIQMSWLPAEFASVGKILKLRDDDGVWDDGWVVREVGNETTEEHLTFVDQIHHRLERDWSKDK